MMSSMNVTQFNTLGQYECSFRAMNTWIEVKFQAAENEVENLILLAKNWFETVEQCFNRFRANSELSYLNRSAGKTCLVSDPMLEVLQLAELYRVKTDHIFEPFVLQALIEAGYCESFELLNIDRVDSSPFRDRYKAQAYPLIALDIKMKSVLLPAGLHLDLGGIVKSWSVKRFASYLRNKRFVEKGLINAGGDLIAWNSSEERTHQWSIGIEDPWNPKKELGVINRNNLAVATSSTLGRQWTNSQGAQHHLIDPRTMRPSTSDTVQCTVIGQDPVECEIWSKTICILGREEGTQMLLARAPGYEALVFTEDYQSHFYGKSELWKTVDTDEIHLTV
ncbi:FAD:protein FMN transferase [Paenibacillus vulneris]|uniref:FAD:protein FMN transferase n=1 Tax=Paenibacillus vulneris TaxID=1133364 RepID=A0ABW3UQT8_9BACL